MITVFLATFRGVLRDRVLQGVLAITLFFFLVPVVASLSMRQVVELSINLSLGLFSFILLLLTVFLGATSLWKDFERRYTYSVLGLPVSRSGYLLGKYAGMASFIMTVALLLGLVSILMVWLTASWYPPTRPVAWGTLLLAEFFIILKYLLLLGFAFLFSTVSTSFFLPVFGTVATYMAGSVTQQVYDYLQTETAMQTVTPLVQKVASGFYYILPNFNAFDLNLQAIYGIEVALNGLILSVAYALLYLGVLLSLSAIIFGRRELT